MCFTDSGRNNMQIHYNEKTDLLYFRLDDKPQSVSNKRVNEDIVLDLGEDGKIVAIEILDASKQIHLEKLLPVNFTKTAA